MFYILTNTLIIIRVGSVVPTEGNSDGEKLSNVYKMAGRLTPLCIIISLTSEGRASKHIAHGQSISEV